MKKIIIIFLFSVFVFSLSEIASAQTCPEVCKSKGYLDGRCHFGGCSGLGSGWVKLCWMCYNCGLGDCCCSLMAGPTTTTTTTTIQSSQCSDPDGRGYSRMSTCTDKSGIGYLDFCYDSKTLGERYCDSQGNCAIERYTCPSGQECKNGACVKSVPACTYTRCEAQNSLPCMCGDIQAQLPWCCVKGPGDYGTYSSQSNCKANCEGSGGGGARGATFERLEYVGKDVKGYIGHVVEWRVIQTDPSVTLVCRVNCPGSQERVPGYDFAVFPQNGVCVYANEGRYTITLECRLSGGNFEAYDTRTVNIGGGQCPLKLDDTRVNSPASVSATFEAIGQGIEQIIVYVYDLSGREIFNSGYRSGTSYIWDLKNKQGNFVADGVYNYKIDARGCGETKSSAIKRFVVQRRDSTTTLPGEPTTTIPGVTTTLQGGPTTIPGGSTTTIWGCNFNFQGAIFVPERPTSYADFIVGGTGIDEIQILISNSAGQTIFDSGRISDLWYRWYLKDMNGRDVPDGTYQYSVNVFGCGQTRTSTGTITLSRGITSTTTISQQTTTTVQGTCAGRCDEKYNPQAPCQCDIQCRQNNDCCGDICRACPNMPWCGATTTTTLPSGGFRTSGFSCSAIIGGYQCSLSYDNQIGENVRVLFLFTDSKGKVVSAAAPIANQGSGSIASAFFCSTVQPGTYEAQWRAYRVSDERLTNIIAWPKLNEIQSIVC